MSDNVSLSVAFTKSQEAAVVGHAMFNTEFLLKCKAHIKPEWLTSDFLVAQVYRELIKFYDKYNMIPTTVVELFAEPFFQAQAKSDYAKYQATAELICMAMQQFNLEHLRPKLADFIRTMKIKESAKSLVADINKQNYERINDIANNLLKIGNDVSFDEKESVDFTDALNIWNEAASLADKPMSTGSKSLDTMLGGGLFRGENMAILAPTFTGKSRFMITLIRHLLVQGHCVLYMIHEDHPEQVKKRIISAMVGVGVREIAYIMQHKAESGSPPVGMDCSPWDHSMGTQLYEVLKSQILLAQKMLDEQLVFVPWQNTDNMFVENVIEELKRLHLVQKIKNGRGFDVILNDYPGLLYSKARHESERSRLSYIYKKFNELAAELMVFCGYAVQVNRHAAKQMKTDEATHTVGLEDVSESYQIAQNAMKAVSLNRTPGDLKHKILRISVIKARDSETANSTLITRARYNEGSLYGDYDQYINVGQFLIEGMEATAKDNTMTDADALNAELEAQEKSVDLMARAAAYNSMPLIIKKIRKLQTVT